MSPAELKALAEAQARGDASHALTPAQFREQLGWKMLQNNNAR